MFLLVFLTIFFSIFSQIVMSHLAINFSLGPWVGPVFVVVSMSTLLPLIAKEWFKKYVMIIVTSSSIGGAIGLGLGVVVPAFYFLKHDTFIALYGQPYIFSIFISMIVCMAMFSALFIADAIKDYFIENDAFVFPMSHSMYRLIEGKEYSEEHKKIWFGIGSAAIWNCIVYVLSYSATMTHFLKAAPFSIAIGFIVGSMLFKPLCIGLLVKFGYFQVLYNFFFASVNSTHFLAVFVFGMLSVHVVQFFYNLYGTHDIIQNWFYVLRALIAKHTEMLIVLIIAACCMIAWFWWLGVGLVEQVFVYAMLILNALYSARLVATLGIVSVQGFVWSIVLPLVYIGAISIDNILLIACFSILFLNIVTDLIFSYKIAHFGSYTYAEIVPYQIIAAIAAIVTSGVWMWLYAHYFAGFSLFEAASSAKNLDTIISITSFHSSVYIAGIACALVLWVLDIEILNIVGVLFMSNQIAFWLWIASGCSLFVKNRQEWTSYWFGVYAMHALWSVCILLVT